MKRLIGMAALLMITSGGLVACGGDNNDDNNGAGEGSIDLGADATVYGSLTAEEKKASCEEIADFNATLITEAEAKQAACTFAASFAAAFSGASTDAELQAACVMSRDECLAAPAMESEGDDMCATSELDDTCTATNGELEPCLEDIARIQITALKSIKCSDLKVDTMEDMMEEMEASYPASCSAVEQKCPAAIGASASTN